MALSNLYNSIAKSYAKIDFFQINSSALLAAVKQLQMANALDDHRQQILDLGSGDGKLLMLIHELYPHAQLVALDASADMLKLVKEKMPRTSVIRGNIDSATQELPANQFDLVLASFVCSYVGMPALLAQAKYLLKKNGYFQVITTTMEAFREIQKNIDSIGITRNPWKKLLYYWMKKTLHKVKSPQNFAEIQQLAEALGFTVSLRHQLLTPMVFNNRLEAQEFAEKGGWAISLIDYPWMPSKLLRKLAVRMLNYISFPFRDEMIVEVVLLKKK